MSPSGPFPEFNAVKVRVFNNFQEIVLKDCLQEDIVTKFGFRVIDSIYKKLLDITLYLFYQHSKTIMNS